MMASNITDIVFFSLKNGKDRQILDCSVFVHECMEISKNLERILTDADDVYRLVINQKTLNKIKNGLYVEVVFKNPKEIFIPPRGLSKVKVKKILLGLEDGFGWQKDGSCNILFGDPDYEEYNIVVATHPHISEEELLLIFSNSE